MCQNRCSLPSFRNYAGRSNISRQPVLERTHAQKAPKQKQRGNKKGGKTDSTGLTGPIHEDPLPTN